MSAWSFGVFGWPWWSVVLLAVALGLVAWRVSGPELASAPLMARRGILWLRVLTLALCASLLLEPVITHRTTLSQRPAVAVVIDASGSMAMTDELMSERHRSAEAAALSSTAGAWIGSTRYQRALALARSQVASEIGERAEVHWFTMSDRLRPLSATGASPQGTTDMQAAFSSLARDDSWSGPAHIGAVLVYGDGRQTAGGDPLPAVRALVARGASIACVAIGDPDPVRDAVVSELNGPSEVFAGERAHLEAKYRISGYPGQAWNLVLSRDGVEVERRSVVGDGGWQIATFDHASSATGSAQWRVALAAQREGAREASLTNNAAELSVQTAADPLRILLVDATPRWESRYLATLFERDRRVNVERRYRTVRLGRGERELLPQTQEALDAYDAIIIGDLTPTDITAADQSRLNHFVSRRGGFLTVISGARAMPMRFSLGPLLDLLPVRISSIAQARSNAAAIRVAMTPAGAAHPLLRVLEDPALNRQLWPLLPAMEWSIRGVTAKAGADVLLEADDRERTPVMAVTRVGAGRVLWLGSDETWRWRDRLGERVHQTVWVQALRWGMGIRLRGADPRLQVAVERAVVEPGEALDVRARTKNTVRPQITAIHLDDTMQPIPGSERRFEMAAVADADGLWSLAIPALDEGHWQLRIASSENGLSETRRVSVRKRVDRELSDVALDLPGMEQIAVVANTQAATAAGSRALIAGIAAHLTPSRSDTTRTWTLWDNYLCLLVIVGLLVIEWLWRKRVGLA